MNYGVDSSKLLKFLILIVIVIVALLALILTEKIKGSIDIDNKIAENIESTGWPKEVPIIKSELVKVDKYVNPTDSTKVSWTIRIKEGISYTQFREYAIELHKAGFEPVKKLGSKAPELLVMNPTIDNDFYIFWYGEKGDLSVEVYWENFNEESKNEIGDSYYTFTVSLRKNPQDNSNDASGDISNPNNISGDHLGDNVSGDNISGDNVSGDNISDDNISGDNISGDRVI